MTDRATITYQLDGTTRHLTVEGDHLAVQMPDATSVTVSQGGRVVRAHLFRVADHVEIERGVDHD